jgi:hypothetical protein
MHDHRAVCQCAWAWILTRPATTSAPSESPPYLRTWCPTPAAAHAEATWRPAVATSLATSTSRLVPCLPERLAATCLHALALTLQRRHTHAWPRLDAHSPCFPIAPPLAAPASAFILRCRSAHGSYHDAGLAALWPQPPCCGRWWRRQVWAYWLHPAGHRNGRQRGRCWRPTPAAATSRAVCGYAPAPARCIRLPPGMRRLPLTLASVRCRCFRPSRSCHMR